MTFDLSWMPILVGGCLLAAGVLLFDNSRKKTLPSGETSICPLNPLLNGEHLTSSSASIDSVQIGLHHVSDVNEIHVMAVQRRSSAG